MSQKPNQQKPSKSKPSLQRVFALRNDRMRKKLLYLGYQMGYDQPRNQEQEQLPAHEINKQNVSAWCQSEKCGIGKPLNHMTGKELAKAVTQFEIVYQKFLKQYAQ